MPREMDLLYDQHDFRFERRWFLNRNLPTFRKYVAPIWKGKPISYLELGVYEGMSLVWMLQRVLTHTKSRAIGIDPWLMTTKRDGEFMEEVRQRAVHNLKPWTSVKRAELVRGNSAEVLRFMLKYRQGYNGWKPGTVDIAMIDGNHWGPYVADDARLCYQLLRPGGWLLFDDVENQRDKGKGHVKCGVEEFKAEHEGRAVFLWKDRYMEAYRKIEGAPE